MKNPKMTKLKWCQSINELANKYVSLLISADDNSDRKEIESI